MSSEVTDFPTIVLSGLVGATLLVIFFLINFFKSQKAEDVQSKSLLILLLE